MPANTAYNIDTVTGLLLRSGKPDKDSSSRIMPYASASLGAHTAKFQALLDGLTNKSTSSKKKSVIALHRRCIEHVLKSLIHCMFRFEWLALPTNDKNFGRGQYLTSLGFDRRRMQRVIETLCSEDLMYLGRKGYLDPTPRRSSKASQYYPTEKFIKLFADSLYTDCENFDEYEALICDRFETKDLPSIQDSNRWTTIITNYNDFMREHNWALKNPSYRKIKDFVGRSGRITNYYQNIANRRIPLRTSTLLDGEPIAEPDFSCNHLRMASYLVGEELPTDPYENIAKETGLERASIKSVVTKVLGATSKQQKGMMVRDAHKDKRSPISANSFRAVLSSIETNYPWVESRSLWFNDVGTRMQWLEGEIALRMLKWSTENEKPLIAVHDAFAVRQQDALITEGEMNDVWRAVLADAKKKKFLETTQGTVAVVAQRKRVVTRG